ncbi:MAG: hypothetical protein O7D32_10135 [bacterium]|nr:hypothetical protein [bacterium]
MRGLRILKWIAVVVPQFVFATSAPGQAWVQKEDGYFFKLAASYLSTDEMFDFQGNRTPVFASDSTKSDGTYREFAITAYLEYGINERLTFVGNLPFKIVSNQFIESLPPIDPRKVTLTNGGVSDLTTSLRAQMLEKPALSLQGGIKIPLGYEQNPDNAGPRLGTGKVDAELGLIGGVSFWPVPAYASGGIGYRWRGGAEFHNEYLFNLETGYTLRRLFMKIRFEGTKNVEDLTQVPSNATTAERQDNIGDQDVYKLLPALTYHFTPGFSATAEAYYSFAGKNTVYGTTWALGLEWNR